MRRHLRPLWRVLIDISALAAAFSLAFLIRFDGSVPHPHVVVLWFTLPYVVIFEFSVLRMFGVHRFVWRYVGLREAVRITVACACAALGLALSRLVVGDLRPLLPHLRWAVIPYGVVAINAGLVFLGVSGVRVVRRLLGERQESARRRRPTRASERAILVGAGQAGVMVARELTQRPDLGILPVGFVDDDPAKLGALIHGIPVLGPTQKLAAICEAAGAQQILITLANAPGHTIRRIRQLAEELGLPTKIIPGLYEIVGGKVNLSRIRNVAIEDLLRREPVALDVGEIASQVTDGVVLVTGAGGSIGSELCRQLCAFKPATLILLERAENALFNIHRELLGNFPGVRLLPCVGDITDAERMEGIFASERPSIVLHAAAHKHVPMMEWNPLEALKNNLLGTQSVVDLADKYQVSVFLMISTDKAVNPSSMMGATKRAAEVYVQAKSQASRTRFVTVRFGNVLGSAGSVIPIFQEQIERGGPVTVTHPEMRRYFMTIPEACQLVLQATSMGKGGEIFILDMGEPVLIVDLARELIALSGLREGEDIEITFNGVRPGEKLFEELSTDSEQADKTRHPKIFVGKIVPRPLGEVVDRMLAMRRAVRERPSQAGAILRQLVPEYRGDLAFSDGEVESDRFVAVLTA